MLRKRIVCNIVFALGLVTWQFSSVSIFSGVNRAEASTNSTMVSPGADNDDLSARKHIELPTVTLCREIAAPIGKVWEAIKARRTAEQGERQLISYDGKVAVIKENFPGMPVIGNTTCTYTESEIAPFRVLDYRLLNSNRLQAFQGSWHLNPGSRPNTTLVSLSSTIDPGIRCPLWRQIARMAIERNVRNTMDEVVSLTGASAGADSSK